MNKYHIIAISCIILITYCNPKISTYNVEIKIDNISQISILVDMTIASPSWDIDSVKLFELNADNSSLSYYRSIGTYKTRNIGIRKLMIYNLIDTTSFNWRIYVFDEVPFEIYQKYKTIEDRNNYTFYEFKISEELLTLFKKDTSMLTQFKDYYNP